MIIIITIIIIMVCFQQQKLKKNYQSHHQLFCFVLVFFLKDGQIVPFSGVIDVSWSLYT